MTNGPVFVSRVVLALTLVACGRARAGEPITAAAFVAQHARTLDEDQVFFRWQSTTSGENLTRAGTMTEALNAHFMSQTSSVTAGPGLYMASDPLSSAGYLPSSGGNLIEVRIPKGTRVIDVEDAAVTKALSEAGLGIEDIYHGKYETKNLLVKYTPTWYVGKNLTDQATFRFFPGPQHNPADLLQVVNDAPRKADMQAAQQLMTQIRQHRADAFEHIVSKGDVNAAYWDLLRSDELARVLESSLEDPARARQILSTLAHNGIPSESIIKKPALLKRAVAAFDQIDFKRLGGAEIDYLTELARRAPSKVGRPVLVKILERSFEDEHFQKDFGRISQRLNEVLPHLELDEKDRSRLARNLTTALANYVDNARTVDQLKSVLAAHSIADPAVRSGVETAETFARRFERARLSAAAADVRAALSDHATFHAFIQAFAKLDSYLATAIVHKGVDDLLKHEPTQFSRLLRSPADYEAAVAFSDQVRDITATLYPAALAAGPLERQAFIERCLKSVPLDWASCRTRMISRAIADEGALFRDLPDAKRFDEFMHSLVYDGDQSGAYLARIIKDRGLHPAGAAADFSVNACVDGLAHALDH